eukprot:10601831-Lingulodinium_polyedra.AAC.1
MGGNRHSNEVRGFSMLTPPPLSSRRSRGRASSFPSRTFHLLASERFGNPWMAARVRRGGASGPGP